MTKYNTLDDHYLVIGAGPVGLAMAKSLKTGNLPYHQVEADDDVGGNWYHGTYKSAHILSARKVMEYPDFPMPEDYPDFPSSSQMLTYYRAYTKENNLRESIQFETKVVYINPIENDLWKVSFENGVTKIYKGIMVCNGHHWSKRYPMYEGAFKGESFHSKEYKTTEQIKDRTVLVIGSGNSAFDIASECARVSKKTYLSVRRGIWIFPKTFMGKPLAALQVPKLPDWLQEGLVKAMLKVTIGSYKEYGLPKPTTKVFDRHPTVNTETLMHVKHGRIKIKGAVSKLQESKVVFEDGSIEEIDTIVYATGFDTSYPFLPKQMNRVEKNHVKVYGLSMYDDYKGIYLVGWMQPRGGVGSLIAPYAELLVNLAKVQDKISCPVGMVLREMGEPLPTTHLMGGGVVLKWITKMNKRIGKIENKGKKLDLQLKGFTNKTLNGVEQAKMKDMQIF
jgi:thioredoxin reductase